MVDILKQLNPAQSANVYSYGKVVSIVAEGIIKIRTTSGLELILRDNSQVYSIGDQLVLGTKKGDLNSAFIIRKINRLSQSSVNFIISGGQG